MHSGACAARAAVCAIVWTWAVAVSAQSEPAAATPPPSEPPPAAPAPEPPAPATEAPAAPAAAPEAPPAPAVVAAPAAPQPSAASATAGFPGSAHALFGPPKDARRHLGFSLRVSIGAGFAWANHELRKDEAKISGPNALISVDAGGTPIENLIVFGRFGGFALSSAHTSDNADASTAFFGLIGAGARYHFMPYDWYTSAAIELALVSVANAIGDSQKAGPGFGFELEAGKNWWAGSYRDRWTVGLGLRFAYARSGSTETQGSDRSREPWTGLALSLVFSASYN
ncbi:MAG TPA: hypothetical protein VJR89_43735 [Polyangiales bacterium]|nr:hypothetical protein [Polyangiales bacterium]